MNRLTILKTSWGIAIFYEIKEIVNFDKRDTNIKEISPLVFLKLNDIIIDETSLKFLKRGVESIIRYIETFPVCFSLEKLQYNICDYQPEGMYYMFRKWFFEKHNMEIPAINVYYDKEKNKYIFPDLIPD